MNIDLGGGRRLLLADLGAGGWAWIAVGLAALVLLVVLYRYERRLVPRGAGLTLLGLRLLAALALVAAMLDPIAARTFTESVRGRLIVGVDRSESMETADPGRPEADRAALGSLLGLSPADNPSRLEVARSLLEGPPGLAAKLEADHTVEPIGFARSSAPGALAALAARPAEGTAAGATDWGPVLEAGLRDGPDGAPVLGVVLLTDGRRNLPPGGTDEAARLAERGVPVFPVLVGSTVPPRDAAVAAVRAPETVYLGDAATVSVEVKADGFEPGAPVVVRLEREGAEPMEQVVRAPGPGEPARPLATFRVELPEAGTHALAVSVSPPGGADLRPDNDRRERVVQVVDDKARVLLVEGEARWEFRYLRNALARDPRVEVDSVLLIPPPAPDGAERSYPDRLPAAPAAGSDQPDPLGAYDVIVLGDLPPSAAPADLWERLDAFVSARGGALIVSAGPRSWPDGWAGDEKAAGMLPVAAPRKAGRAASAGERQGPWPGGARVVPASLAAAEPEQWPMLQFAAEPAASLAVWDGLPPLPWALAGRPKPGAVVLAAAAGQGPADDSAAVIATHAYGLGKVLWIGTDGTWRWRLRVGDAYHHRFWGQLVRWAAGGKLSAGNRLVRFGPDRARTPEGEPPTFQARFSEAAPGVTPSLLAAARVVRAGEGEGAEAVALVPLRSVADRPGVFEGLPPALPPGSYVARLEVPELEAAFKAEGLEAPEAAFEVAERETTERIELAASRDALEGLASATGGRVLADFEAGGLPDLLRSRVVEKSRTEESALWDTPWGLGLFFGLLALEWIVRKRAGLP